MIRTLNVALVLFISSAVMADTVSDAYDKAYASGQAAFDQQKKCEASSQEMKLKSCKLAEASYDKFQALARSFMSSVEPKDLFNHVTTEQMNDLTSLNRRIGESMDHVSDHLSANE